MTLTVTQVKNAAPQAQNYKLSDSRGLFLLVITAGGKSWRFKYRFGGKEKLLTLGRYPELSLAAARLRYAAEAAGGSHARAQQSFVPVVADAAARSDRAPIDASIEVEIGDAVVWISRAAEIKLVTAVVQALRR